MRRAVQIRVFNASSGASRLEWMEVDELAAEASQGPPGPKGDKGDSGRTAAIFEQSIEPVNALPGDYWIIGD